MWWLLDYCTASLHPCTAPGRRSPNKANSHSTTCYNYSKLFSHKTVLLKQQKLQLILHSCSKYTDVSKGDSMNAQKNGAFLKPYKSYIWMLRFLLHQLMFLNTSNRTGCQKWTPEKNCWSRILQAGCPSWCTTNGIKHWIIKIKMTIFLKIVKLPKCFVSVTASQRSAFNQCSKFC